MTNLLEHKTILLVEDNKIAQLISDIILREFTSKVDIAETGQQALELYDKYHHNIIFMDISLPDGKGYDFARQLYAKEREPNTPPPLIIAISAHSDDETKMECFSAGITNYLVKPLERSKLEDFLF